MQDGTVNLGHPHAGQVTDGLHSTVCVVMVTPLDMLRIPKSLASLELTVDPARF